MEKLSKEFNSIVTQFNLIKMIEKMLQIPNSIANLLKFFIGKGFYTYCN